jgi:hypothetical protein
VFAKAAIDGVWEGIMTLHCVRSKLGTEDALPDGFIDGGRDGIDNGKDDGALLGFDRGSDEGLVFQTAAETALSSTIALVMAYVLLGVEIGSKKRVVKWLICPCLFKWSTRPRCRDVAGSFGCKRASKLKTSQQESQPEKQLLPALKKILRTPSEIAPRLFKEGSLLGDGDWEFTDGVAEGLDDGRDEGAWESPKGDEIAEGGSDSNGACKGIAEGTAEGGLASPKVPKMA